MKYLLLLATCVLAACTSNTIQTNHYLLRSDNVESVSRQMDASGILLSHVGIAGYINKLGIVLETSSGEVSVAKHHLWAEPLRMSVSSFLADEITAAIGKDVYVNKKSVKEPTTEIRVDINQLHGTYDGNAVLVALWTVDSLHDGKISQSSYKFSQKLSLEADGYDALVSAEKKLLIRLAEEIGESFQ